MASLQDLEAALVNADKAGDADAARRLAVAVRDARANQSAADRIPGAGPAPQKQEEHGIAQRIGNEIVGAGEAALSMASAIPATVAGGAGSTLQTVAGLIHAALGNDEQARALISDPNFERTMQSMVYRPRTDAGQRDAEAAMNFVAPLAGLGGEAAALSQAMRLGRSGATAGTTARAATEGIARDAGAIVSPAVGEAAAAGAAKAIDATANAARTVQRSATTLPSRAWAKISKQESTPTPGTMGSAGAAGTDVAAQRVATAESVGLTGEAALTRGQATRDPAQLKFETDTAGKNMELGGAIRQRRIAQNEALLRTIENDIDSTGAISPTVRATGKSVDKALTAQYARDKASVDAAYTAARKSPEAGRIVDQTAQVTIGEGDRAITGTPIDYINQQPTGLPSSAVADSARQYAVKLGIADMENGKLVPRPATIQQMEDWRSSISQSIDSMKDADIRHGTIMKGLIDAQTEPAIGPIFRNARNMRTRLAQNFEDRATVAKLLSKKPGTQDRAVALEDVFDHSIMKGSLDDVRNMRRILQRGGEDGAQAWRELQGQTLKRIRDDATKSVAADSAGNRVLSPAALDKSIRALDHDGKLEFIFGKLGAQRLRDINDIAQVAKTVPPEAAINFSNTATTLLTASADLGAALVTGVPAPLATATKLGLKHIKDRNLRARINDALSYNPSEQKRP
ncbi:MAG: hypothetical protein RL758_136 [Pseudomonadota bacterium]|jgi:hypothetical protein